MSAQRLYTPSMLAAAVELAQYPPLHGPSVIHGKARSPTCGAHVAIDLERDTHGRIAHLGLRVTACAVGQAASAVFARHAIGRSDTEIATINAALRTWLDGTQPAPDWPDLDLIAPARDYSARHGAIRAPWRAALAALSSADTAG